MGSVELETVFGEREKERETPPVLIFPFFPPRGRARASTMLGTRRSARAHIQRARLARYVSSEGGVGRGFRPWGAGARGGNKKKGGGAAKRRALTSLDLAPHLPSPSFFHQKPTSLPPGPRLPELPFDMFHEIVGHLGHDPRTLVAAFLSRVPGLVEAARASLASCQGKIVSQAVQAWLTSLGRAGTAVPDYYQDNWARLDELDWWLVRWAFHHAGRPGPITGRPMTLGPDLRPAEVKWAAARSTQMGLVPDKMIGRDSLVVTMPAGWSLPVRAGAGGRTDEEVRQLLVAAAFNPMASGS